MIVMFIAPALLIYVVFVAFPYVQGLLRSLTMWSGLSGRSEFVGLGNYAALLEDRLFLQSVANNVALAAVSVVPIFGIALLIAAMLARPGRFSAVLRAVIVLPLLLSLPAVAVLARQIFQINWGLVNSALRVIGLESLATAWLGDPDTALFAVAATWIWFATSFYILIFYAAIVNIPEDLYLAASVDGANAIQAFRHLTVPLIWDTIRVSIVFFIVGMFIFAFPLIHVMTEGGPSNSTEVMATRLYKEAFISSKFGYASAIGVAILLVAIVMAAVSTILTRREVVEY